MSFLLSYMYVFSDLLFQTCGWLLAKNKIGYKLLVNGMYRVYNSISVTGIKYFVKNDYWYIQVVFPNSNVYFLC